VGLISCSSLPNPHVQVMEAASGGELRNWIKKGNYTEARAAEISRSILRMVAQCHARDIVYRDIKPSNFMFVTNTEESVLKGTDFGLAVHCPPGTPKLTDITGTPYYIAPEAVNQNYSFEADIWSAGVLIYQILCGRVPFPPNPQLKGQKRVADLFDRILKQPIDLSSPPAWPAISDSAKDLVSRLLIRDPAKRITIKDALAHPWLKHGAASDQKPLERDVVQRLQRYSTYGPLRQQVMVTALGMMQDKSGKVKLPWSTNMEILEEMFAGMDKDHTGGLSREEIAVGLRNANYAITDIEVQQLFRSIDVDKTGKITWNEFLAAMIDWEAKDEVVEGDEDSGTGDIVAPPASTSPLARRSKRASLDLIWKSVFDKYDTDGDGIVSVDEIAEVLHVPKDSPLIRDVLREVDTDGSGRITFEGFNRMMAVNPKDDLNFYSCRKRTSLSKEWQ